MSSAELLLPVDVWIVSVSKNVCLCECVCAKKIARGDDAVKVFGVNFKGFRFVLKYYSILRPFEKCGFIEKYMFDQKRLVQTLLTFFVPRLWSWSKGLLNNIK